MSVPLNSRNFCHNFNLLSSFCGIAAPIIYAVSLITAGILRPGYNHLTQYASYLGTGSDLSAVIMNYFGFLTFGILIIIFGIGLPIMINGNKILRFSLGLIIVIFGFSTSLYALFPIDDAGATHDILSKIAGMIYFTPWLASIIFMKDRNWVSFWRYSISIMFAIVIVYIIFILISTDLVGLFQRVAFGLILVWIEMTSIGMLILIRKTWKPIS